MYSNEQCSEIVNKEMKAIECFINALEAEVKKENPDIKTIANIVGKMSQVYSFIAEITGVFSGVDFRNGGFKESSWSLKKA